MKIARLSLMVTLVLWGAGGLWAPGALGQPAAPRVAYAAEAAPPDDASAPAQPVKLIFIHHSTGENWLNDYNGHLGIELRNNNYFVSDTNYGWGPNEIGSATDIGNWYQWFGAGRSAAVLNALYAESDQHAGYSRLENDPGGANAIIMFKSCFPNSALRGSLADPIPAIGANPLRGQGAGSDEHTVSNAKGIYLDLLSYFQTQPGKLFVAIAAPPLSDGTYAVNARAFNEWLADPVNGWLKDYPLKNVAVFDFYNVLTTNGGDAHTNDLGLATGNHHRWWQGAVQHKSDVADNTLAYPSGDDHPSAEGGQKASQEFVPLLNVFYHRWQATISMPAAVTDLHLTRANPGAGQLTTTLAWTPPGNALTVTVRYSATVITSANWGGATVLTSTLPGGLAAYTSTVPYTSGLVYFALRTQNAVGWSAMSNNMFWPQHQVFLPLGRR